MGFFSGIIKKVTGSIFGEKGLLGGLFGGGSSGPTAEERAAQVETERKQTGEAYEYGRGSYELISGGREQAEKTYETSLSAGRAKMAASGAKLEGAVWEGVQGEALRERTEKLEGFDRDLEQFRASESYKLIKEDYERIEGGGEGRSGESFYTKEQQKKIKGGLTRSGDDTEYQKRLRPTLEQYEQGKFGTKDQKAEFKSMMDQRIKDANTWFTNKKNQRKVEKGNSRSFYGGGR